MEAFGEALELTNHGGKVVNILSELNAAGSCMVALEVHLARGNDSLVGDRLISEVVSVNGLSIIGLDIAGTDG